MKQLKYLGALIAGLAAAIGGLMIAIGKSKTAAHGKRKRAVKAQWERSNK